MKIEGEDLELPDTPCVVRAYIYASALSQHYFAAPVYLVGSSLVDPDPRDIDIVVPITDALFVHAYGDPHEDSTEGWESGKRMGDPTPMWRRWAKDCAKQSRQMTYFCERFVDFKTQPASYFATYEGKPRLRLDCRLRG